MHVEVVVPAGVFEGSSGLLYYKSREKYNIQSGVFIGYSKASDRYEHWSIQCDEQPLMMLLLANTVEVIQLDPGRVWIRGE